MTEKKVKCPVCSHEWNIQYGEKRKYYICPYCRTVFGTAQHPLSELLANEKASKKE
jgi:uncharacterized CHY-type Zn-finger protein